MTTLALQPTHFQDVPRPSWFWGNLRQFNQGRLKMLKDAAAYGPVARLRFVNHYVYLLTDPDDIKHVLVDNHRNYHKGRGLEQIKAVLGDGLLTSEEEFHARQRRMIQPAFHRQRIAAYAEIMTRFTAQHIEHWQPGQAIDLHEEMMHLTMVIVARCLFDTDVSAESADLGPAISQLIADFRPDRVGLLGLLLSKFDRKGQQRFAVNKGKLDTMLFQMISRRRAEGSDRGDLLSMLIGAQEDGKGMSDSEMRDELMTLFLAGHETTAIALTWTFYLLSQNPDVEEKLRAELTSVLGDPSMSRLPTWDDLPKLDYTRRVFAESMRLYPPAWVTSRRALHDDQTSHGVRIPANVGVLLSPWLTHHDPTWWPDPERFDPDRFLPEQEATRPKFAYFPFGGGPRRCIGEPFALMEGVLLLATVVHRVRLKLKEGYVPELLPQVTLRPKQGMPMVVA